MFPPTPLSLLCALLLCLPLAILFTFNPTILSIDTVTTPASPITTLSDSSAAGAASSITTPTTNNTSVGVNIDKTKLPPDTTASPTPPIKNQTTVNTTSGTPSSRPSQLINDDGDDDGSLFQLASRANPNPKSIKKLALMFLTTTPLPFAPLWELFLKRAPKNLYNIYVHADPSFNYTPPFQGVFDRRIIPSKPTRRHSPGLISAARRLLSHALLHDKSNYMFALFSPACIPIHSFNYTYTTLIKSRKSFIEILKNEPGAYDRWAARGEDVMAPEVKYEDFRIGSQFWVIKRKHARIIVRDRRLWSKFKLPCLRDDTCYPEEHYFPTLLSTVDPRGCIPCTLTHVDWNGGDGDGHPRMYQASEVQPELIWTLRNLEPRYGNDKSNGWNSSVMNRRDPGFLFARKFSPDLVQRLMSIANDIIFKD